MALEPPGQFPSNWFIKSLLQINEEWPWSRLGSFLQISLSNPNVKSVENGPGASWAVYFSFPY